MGAGSLIAKLMYHAVRELNKNIQKNNADNVGKNNKQTAETDQSDIAQLMNHLGRSKIYTFEQDKSQKVILTSCVKDHIVKELTVPDAVDQIGREAFKDCKFLESITIPESVRTIEYGAFSGCENLKEVHFSEGLRKIDSHAFNGCGLVEVVLPKSIDIMGDGVFYNCKELRSVILPENLRSFKNGIFYGCESLEEVLLPQTMRGAMCNVFAHCKSLEHIEIPDGISVIDNWCFEYCYKLTDVYIPDSVTKICNRAFLHCKSLKKIYIPDSVSEIEIAAVFAGCSALESVRLPIGIRFTPKYEKNFDKIFYDCTSLKTVILGSHSFKVDEPPDEKGLVALHIQLAVMGNPSARDYICERFDEVFGVLIDTGDIELTDKLLAARFMTEDRISVDVLDKSIDHAAETGTHEIYLMLVKFKQEKFGFDTVAGRFEL